MQRYEKFRPERRTIIDLNGLKHFAREADVAEVHSAAVVVVRKGERQTGTYAPFRVDDTSLTRRVDGQHARFGRVDILGEGTKPMLRL